MAIKDKAFLKRLFLIVFVAPLFVSILVSALIALPIVLSGDITGSVAIIYGPIFGSLLAYPIMFLFGLPLILWIEYKSYDRSDARIIALVYGFIVAAAVFYYLSKDSGFAMIGGAIGSLGAWIVHAMLFFKRP